ncbi:anthranilate phosphoribosyltransferase [Bifidobacterium aquikefiricola]|uniref:Anthranilate phosphoribosyltransferase n=1 Tax=Bifidobacterium aquikefiricola TaxID=3059038 RepID=A0AB39U4M1_9BIFI
MTEPFTWKSTLATLVAGTHLSAEQSEWYMDELMSGKADPAPVAAVLAVQSALGFTSEEVAGAAKAMVAHAVPLRVSGETTDIVGTGGDGAATVNLSTMGAIIAAAAGVKIVKHGNRAATSKCGAADCLEALGLPLDIPATRVGEIGDEVGITFAFAKTFHPSMRFAGPVRSALGVTTIFNLLGPLTNPAQPSHVAIGCAKRELSPMMADVYARRGQSGMVYTSSEGLDEMAPTGPVSVWEIRDGQVRETEFDPTVELGLDTIDVADLRGGEPAFNAQVARDLFDGKRVPSRSTALLNAASAIVADGHLLDSPELTLTERFKQAYEIAENAVDSGAAHDLLERWISVAQR